jgi:hypothetical protein
MSTEELQEYMDKIAQQAADNGQPSLLNIHDNDLQIAINNTYLHEYKLYYQLFKKIPNVYELFRLDKEKAISFLQKEYKNETLHFFAKKCVSGKIHR